MGFTGLARWANAPITGLDIVRENIMQNHQAQYVGHWQLSIRSYRSTFLSQAGAPAPPERSMCTLTMGDNAFLYIDDPAAPSRAEVLAAQMHPPSQSTPPPATPPPSLTQPVESQVTQTEPHTQSERSNQPVTVQPFRVPPHYRMTFLTVRPPGALEHLLLQLRARWMPIRQTSQMNAERGAGAEQRYAGQHVVINGHILRIGQDWLVRIGNVALAGGALRGMLLEAEYLPLPVLPTGPDGSSELLSNLLLSIIPFSDAMMSAVTVSDGQWAEIEPDEEVRSTEPAPKFTAESSELGENAVPDGIEAESLDAHVDDDVYVYADEEQAEEEPRKGDWTGVERDRRSAFLIMGALRGEGLV